MRMQIPIETELRTDKGKRFHYKGGWRPHQREHSISVFISSALSLFLANHSRSGQWVSHEHDLDNMDCEYTARNREL